MIPHERSLVKKLEGKPFALIGVNSDPVDDELKENIKKHEVTWRSFKNGDGDNAIATEWKIRGWPTLYLIDHKGIVRKKWVGGPGEKAMDEAVEKLVAEAVKDQAK